MDRIENDDFSSQLRSLRLILGKNFKPISTEALASITGISLLAIRGVEAGRRQLNDKDRENIAQFAGARWNESTHQWTYVGNAKLPYTRSVYEKIKWTVSSGERTAKNAETLVKSINILASILQPKNADIAIRDLHFEVERIARENNITPDHLEILRSLRSSLIVFPHDLDETIEEPISTSKKTKARG